MWQQLNIGKRLILGFGLLLILFIATIGFVVSRIDYLTSFTENLYEHPLQVTNAILRIEKNIISMRRSMLELTLAENAQMQQAAINDLNNEESLVYDDFKIVEERFLGDLRMTKEAKEAFSAWKPLRDETIQLIGLNKKAEAIENIRTKGAAHVSLLEKLTGAHSDFAVQKATEFYQNTVTIKETVVFWIMMIVGLVIVLCLAIFFVITKSVTAPIKESVATLQSTAAELETISRQQMSASAEQTTSFNEVSATSAELVATAKQIATNTKQVAETAQITVASGRKGRESVENAKDGMEKTKKQVQLIAQHMLDLGNKSQRIGVVLEIINELSEQTNLLSLNATIEAAGAGEAGQRFAVVADEVRKLAERSTASTKEIKELITDIQQTANTTIMVTEDGTKAVDEGVNLFSKVSMEIAQIVTQAENTSVAAREIELTTRQQTTSIEQVSQAMNDLSVSAKQTEQSSNQTLETVRSIVDMSNELKKLI